MWRNFLYKEALGEMNLENGRFVRNPNMSTQLRYDPLSHGKTQAGIPVTTPAPQRVIPTPKGSGLIQMPGVIEPTDHQLKAFKGLRPPTALHQGMVPPHLAQEIINASPHHQQMQQMGMIKGPGQAPLLRPQLGVTAPGNVAQLAEADQLAKVMEQRNWKPYTNVEQGIQTKIHSKLNPHTGKQMPLRGHIDRIQNLKELGGANQMGKPIQQMTGLGPGATQLLPAFQMPPVHDMTPTQAMRSPRNFNISAGPGAGQQIEAIMNQRIAQQGGAAGPISQIARQAPGPPTQFNPTAGGLGGGTTGGIPVPQSMRPPAAGSIASGAAPDIGRPGAISQKRLLDARNNVSNLVGSRTQQMPAFQIPGNMDMRATRAMPIPGGYNPISQGRPRFDPRMTQAMQMPPVHDMTPTQVMKTPKRFAGPMSTNEIMAGINKNLTPATMPGAIPGAMPGNQLGVAQKIQDRLASGLPLKGVGPGAGAKALPGALPVAGAKALPVAGAGAMTDDMWKSIQEGQKGAAKADLKAAVKGKIAKQTGKSGVTKAVKSGGPAAGGALSSMRQLAARKPWLFPAAAGLGLLGTGLGAGYYMGGE